MDDIKIAFLFFIAGYFIPKIMSYLRFKITTNLISKLRCFVLDISQKSATEAKEGFWNQIYIHYGGENDKKYWMTIPQAIKFLNSRIDEVEKTKGDL